MWCYALFLSTALLMTPEHAIKVWCGLSYFVNVRSGNHQHNTSLGLLCNVAKEPPSSAVRATTVPYSNPILEDAIPDYFG